MIIAGTGIFLFKKDSGSSTTGMLQIDLTTFKSAKGWGYDIKVGPAFHIHQDHIPGVSGYKMFATEADALKTGQFLVQKIKQTGKTGITLEEIKALGIQY